mmetsp:Transcript_15299/g.39349  ORF Transcript_15299/g.39349 Transcript_15299/m.39349 type:complete len:324 (-) Transcript_15299:276-1247(-)
MLVPWARAGTATLCRGAAKRGMRAPPVPVRSIAPRLLLRSRAPGFRGKAQGQPSLIRRPAIFCGAVTAGAFGVAAWVRSGDVVARWNSKGTRWHWGNGRLNRDTGTNPVIEWWATVSVPERVVGAIAASYVAVFAMWRVPRLSAFMMDRFIHYPYSGRLAQLVGCHFSHVSVMHLAFNTMALWSFGVPMATLLGPDQFGAVCVGAGMTSAMMSQLHSVVTRCAQPGLGASGVIMGLVGAFAFTHPNGVIYVPFLPFIQGSAVQAFGLLVAVDLAGLALGWRVLGHAAHLGGQLFGAGYVLGAHHVLFDAPVNLLVDLRLRAGW